MIHELYTHELLAMKQKDQKMRIDADPRSGRGGLAEWDPYLDILHTEKLKGIIEDIGWPTISKVGKAASEAAWILVQYAMDDKTFMEHCLELMKEAGEDIERWEIAYLTDRLLMMEEKSQLYGTQYRKDETGRIRMWKVEDLEKLDERRKEMGLEPSEGEEWLGQS